MTCIVGLVDGGKVYIGGDSAGVAGLDIYGRADQKVFKVGDFIMGFTTSFRMGQLLRYSFIPPKRHTENNIYKFMVTDFIDAVRKCLKDGGFAKKENDVERGGVFLVGYAGRLFKVEGDYQVGETILQFDSCGCGESFALGSLYTTKTQKDPIKRINVALEAAQEFSAGVREPFNIIEGGE